ncbi:MAG: hypothetical protein QNJ51_22315 [Calothrix sp. MO_167.B12]|nr:hypothetical protein [Calothrix sp. MO_167.B12]
MKENNSGSFSNNHNIRILLICACTALISGVGGYLLGSPSVHQLLFSQKVAANTVNTPSPKNKIPQTNLSPTTAESRGQKPDTSANSNQDQIKIQDLEKRLNNTEDYKKSISDTVFPSVLGTVLTILAFQWLTNIWDRLRVKEKIQRELQDWLEKEELIKLQNNLQMILWNQSEQIFSRIEIKIKWLEYQIAVLAAEQMEMQQQSQTSNMPREYQEIQEYSRQPILLEQRIQAIRALQYLESEHQGPVVKGCLEEELAAVKYFFEKITPKNLEKTPILNKQIEELNELFKVDEFSRDYGKSIHEINRQLTKLKT